MTNTDPIDFYFDFDAALGRGMFGAPYVIIDGEPFWGADRLPQIEKWLETGGF